MRNLQKLASPVILVERHEEWLSAFLLNKTNATNKYRYRHPEIKERLKEEAGWKCVYCESKIGHNTPGDIEHKMPSSKAERLHFTWENLTIACSECNRRKNDYYEHGMEFLDPYMEDVEAVVEHYGPIMGWISGNTRAEITIKTLELHNAERFELILRKIEKIDGLNNLVERYKKENNPEIKLLIKHDIKQIIDKKSEYSGMMLSIVNMKNLRIN